MYVTFKNNSADEKMIVFVNNQKHIILPGEAAEVFCQSEKVEFEAQTAALDELADAVDELDEEAKGYNFKNKILAKFTKKFAEKFATIVLNTSVKYEVSCTNLQDTVINLYGGEYSVCDGKIAEMFDILPVGFMFSRAEAEFGKISATDITATNRKEYLKFMRNILFFANWGLIFLDLFFFIPEYLTVRFFSSHFYMKRLFVGLYKKSESERTRILYEKKQQYEKEEKGKGCLSSILKGLIVFLVLGLLCYCVMKSEPDVLIAEDFSSVVCFDETFIKIDGGLPADAKDAFLQDYSAYYPLTDGGYDMDNYYCYIYETADGTRYMWLKDNCGNAENADKDYKDYENPLVYKSVGEKDE